ncbi:MAG: ankyrin repeat domain-containing protein [Rhodospirillaceae bacterium]|nr:ankyrin repeat domain-containing protein [Rhodospirillaceae bacterium]
MRISVGGILAALVIFVFGPAQAQVPPGETEYAAYKGLHLAAASGDVAEIRRLAADTKQLNARDSYGRTPLMVAAYKSRIDAATALIAAGADLDALESDRYDVVTISSVANDVKMLKLVLESGAKAGQMTSPYDGTALIAAAHLGHVDVVKALIAAGAPLDNVNNLNWTALIESIVLGDGGSNHVACLTALIEAGADVNIADGNGVSPLQLAERHGFDEMVRLLKAAGAK